MENPSTATLTELPPEILFLIADHTQLYSAISALARTTRRLHEVLNPYLYRINSRQAEGGYALLWAARYGNGATLRLALKSPNRLVSSRPLLIAARHGHDEVVRHLLSVAGVDIQAKDNEGNTALARAIAAGREEVVEILLDAGALPDPKTSHRSYQKEARSAVFHAIESGHTCIVKQLLARGRVNVKAKYKDHRTALSLSAKLGHLELVQLFLDLGVPVNTRHSKGHTPLVYAIESGSPDVVKVLLDSGADPNSLHPPNQNTPIFFALRSKEPQEPVLQALVDNPKVNLSHANKNGDTPLSFALKTWSKYRYISLSYYAEKCSDETVAMLLTRNDLDPNQGDAFAKAIHQNRLSIAERIFSNPKLTRESKFKGLQEIISCQCANTKPTCEAMFTPLFEYFLAHCLDINEPIFDDMSLLMFACLRGHERAVELLLEHGVHPDSGGYANTYVAVHYPSPLHCAIRGGSVQIVERLLQTGEVDLDCPAGPYGFNAFLSAVDLERIGILRVLREKTDTNPNVTDARGMCAAALIAQKRWCLYNDFMRDLLEWDGVDASIVDDTGKSAVDYARERRNTRLEVMLRVHINGHVLLPVRRRRVRGRKSRNGKKGQQSGDTETLWRCYGVLGGDTLYSARLIRGA